NECVIRDGDSPTQKSDGTRDMARTPKAAKAGAAAGTAPKAASKMPTRRKAAAQPDKPQNGDVAPGKVVGAVAGAIKILRYLADSRVPLGVSRIAKDTKLNTSTSFNILRTLAME